MNDQWLKDIQQRMSEYETDAPRELWDSIAQRQSASATPGNSHRKTLLPLWSKRLIGVAAMLVVMLTIVFWLSSEDDHTANNATTTGHQHLTQTSPAKIISAGEISADNAPAAPRLTFVSENYATEASNKTHVLTDTGLSPELKSQDYVTETTTPSNSSDTATIHPLPAIEDGATHTATQQRQLHKTSTSPATSKLTFGVYTSGGLSDAFGHTRVGDVNSNAMVAGKADAAWSDAPMLGLLLFNKNQSTVDQIKHRMPLHTGFTISYALTPRLSLTSGVTYSLLISDLHYGSDDNYLSGTQTLHYVGIPLGIKYDIFTWHRFETYVAANVLAEKCVSGRQEQNINFGDTREQTQTQHIMDRPIQWSASASLGVQYNILPTLGVYIEPGVSYYIDNGSDVRNIYKDKCLNFNLNIGLRLNLNK